MSSRVAPAERKSLRPPLKWAGGKRWLVPHLRSLWEPYRDRRLVEPLCGGLAVVYFTMMDLICRLMGLDPGRFEEFGS